MITPEQLKALAIQANIDKAIRDKIIEQEVRKRIAQEKTNRQVFLENTVTNLVESELTEDRLIIQASMGNNHCHVFTAMHSCLNGIKNKYSFAVTKDEYDIVRRRFKELVEPKGFKVKETTYQEDKEDRHWNDFESFDTFATEGIGFHVEW